MFYHALIVIQNYKTTEKPADIGAAGIGVLGNDIGYHYIVSRPDLAAADIGAALQGAAGRQRAFLLYQFKAPCRDPPG